VVVTALVISILAAIGAAFSANVTNQKADARQALGGISEHARPLKRRLANLLVRILDRAEARLEPRLVTAVRPLSVLS